MLVCTICFTTKYHVWNLSILRVTRRIHLDRVEIDPEGSFTNNFLFLNSGFAFANVLALSVNQYKSHICAVLSFNCSVVHFIEHAHSIAGIKNVLTLMHQKELAQAPHINRWLAVSIYFWLNPWRNVSPISNNDGCTFQLAYGHPLFKVLMGWPTECFHADPRMSLSLSNQCVL